MWATDATQIATVRDGKVWLFGVVEHWNAEALGWHVAKRGDRYAAVQAVGMAVRHVFGHVSPSAARGLALRHTTEAHPSPTLSRTRSASGA
jgi:putative transposase